MTPGGGVAFSSASRAPFAVDGAASTNRSLVRGKKPCVAARPRPVGDRAGTVARLAPDCWRSAPAVPRTRLPGRSPATARPSASPPMQDAAAPGEVFRRGPGRAPRRRRSACNPERAYAADQGFQPVRPPDGTTSVVISADTAEGRSCGQRRLAPRQDATARGGSIARGPEPEPYVQHPVPRQPAPGPTDRSAPPPEPGTAPSWCPRAGHSSGRAVVARAVPRLAAPAAVNGRERQAGLKHGPNPESRASRQ
jgi:hypothetical protein